MLHFLTLELIRVRSRTPQELPKLRAKGLGRKKISRELGIGVGTVLRIAQEARKGGSENVGSKTFRTTARFRIE